VRSGALPLVLAALVAVDCTQGRPEPRARSPAALPRCEERPGKGVEGFALHEAHEVRYRTHVAFREEYRDAHGRRLFYLLGVVGEMGEGPGEFEPVTLADGTPATFFGQRDGWGVFWASEHPCPQMAVIGNRMDREEFIGLMQEARILASESAFRLQPFQITEWVAVLRTAPASDALREDTDFLLQTAPGNLIVGPVGCHEGLAESLDVAEGSYFSGVVAETERELSTILEVVGTHPRFAERPLLVGEFVVLCGF
jgi:hypothetical protein